MLERTKAALVSSFVGAIALGWVFAQGILHFANMFVAPFSNWIMKREYSGVLMERGTPAGFSLQDALPELARSIAYLIVGYLLLRWLYFKPVSPEVSEPPSEPSS